MEKEPKLTADGTSIVEGPQKKETWFVIRHKPSGTYILDPISGTDGSFGNDANEIFLTEDISKAARTGDSCDVHNLVTGLAFTYTANRFNPTQEFDLIHVELVVEPKYALTVHQCEWFTDGLESAEGELNKAARAKVDRNIERCKRYVQ